MSPIQQSSIENRLLALLSPHDFAALQPYLERVPLERGQFLSHANELIEYAYFIEKGICSVLGAFGEDRLEVGMSGPEGMVAVPSVLGLDRAPQSYMAQANGEALRIPAQALQEIMRQNGPVNSTLLRYVHCFMIQTTQTAYANAEFTIDQRLARWILMTDDRIPGGDLPLTHDFLSLMIGTRRASITTSMHILEGEGLIRSTRGKVQIRDREKLQEKAGAAYGVAEAEYDRLFGLPMEVSNAEVSS